MPDDKNRVIRFWSKQFREVHGFNPLFERKDAVQLHRLRDRVDDDHAMAYAIGKYMRDDDKFIAAAGWSVGAFKTRLQGYLVKFYRAHPISASPHGARMDKVIGRIGGGE